MGDHNERREAASIDERGLRPPAAYSIRDGVTGVLTLEGELDLAAAPELRKRVDEFDGESLVLDMTRVTFIDSAVLRVLITAQERASAQGAGFAIAVADSSGHGVHRLLTLTGLDAKLSTRPSREDAIAAAGAR